MRIDGCSAIVTGGASGLGLATATELANAGAHIVIADLPNSPGEERAQELGGAFVGLDVTDESGVQAAVDAAAAAAPLRIVVNCAGIGTPGRVLGKQGVLPLEHFARVVTVNLIGTFNVIRLAAAKMVESDPVDGERGVIVNTASVAAFDGQIGQAAYASSKGGIIGLTLPGARDLAQHGIRVMTIAPGIMLTPMMQTVSEDFRTALAAGVPFPSRLGDPAEYAKLVLAIIDNDYLNGEVVRLDGALRMAPR